MIKAHTWKWLLDHSYASDVEALMSAGFGAVRIVRYRYNMAGNIENNDKKIIAFNRGQNVRVTHYSEQMAATLGLLPSPDPGKELASV